MHVQQMISTHPQVRNPLQGGANDALVRCIEALVDCAQTCVACADACLAEPTVTELRQCIRLDLDCAAVCGAAGTVISRRTGSNEPVVLGLLQTCETACRLCAKECGAHAGHMQHCRVCAEACGLCARACAEALASLAGRVH